MRKEEQLLDITKSTHFMIKKFDNYEKKIIKKKKKKTTKIVREEVSSLHIGIIQLKYDFENQ